MWDLWELGTRFGHFYSKSGVLISLFSITLLKWPEPILRLLVWDTFRTYDSASAQVRGVGVASYSRT